MDVITPGLFTRQLHIFLDVDMLMRCLCRQVSLLTPSTFLSDNAILEGLSPGGSYC